MHENSSKGSCAKSKPAALNPSPAPSIHTTNVYVVVRRANVERSITAVRNSNSTRPNVEAAAVGCSRRLAGAVAGARKPV